MDMEWGYCNWLVSQSSWDDLHYYNTGKQKFTANLSKPVLSYFWGAEYKFDINFLQQAPDSIWFSHAFYFHFYIFSPVFFVHIWS